MKRLVVFALIAALVAGALAYWLVLQPQQRGPLHILSKPDYEPPIHALFVLHFDPPATPPKKPYFSVEERETVMNYERSRDELIWLLDFCQGNGVKMTALFNGFYPQIAMRRGELEPIERLLDEGHEVGTHAHSIRYNESTDRWVSAQDPYEFYSSAKYFVDEVLEEVGSGENVTVCAALPKGKYGLEDELMEEYGFWIATGNRPDFATKYFGHQVWNPWRARCSDERGHELEEDLSVDFVSIDHRSQIGSPTAHGVNSTVPELKKDFLTLYVEWKMHELMGLEDKVWSWGVVHHPNYGDQYNQDIEEFFLWLNEHFIGKKTPHGSTVAVYATARETAEDFLAWEREHPGKSSFSYVEGGEYPYMCKYSWQKLSDATYVGDLNLGEGVEAFEFRSADGKVFYLCWSDIPRELDLSSFFQGSVKATNPLGVEKTYQPNKVVVTEEPVFLEPA